MSKIKTKELLNEVTNYIQKEFGYEVVDSFSDYGNKSTVIKKNPKFVGDVNHLTTEIKYFGVCEFSVHKKNKTELFIILDYREKQPFGKSNHWINPTLDIDLKFGRYEFNNRVDFYNYIISDYGLTIFDRMRLEGEKEISLTF